MTASPFINTLRSVAAAAMLVAAASHAASASPIPGSWQTAMPSAADEAATDSPHAQNVRLAQDSCSAAAAEAAAQSGGQVLSVSTSEKGGRTVCVVTVLVPGHDGSRPRRTTVSVPL